MKKTYLTTTLPYVNAAPHVGFALEIIQADIIARYRRLLGDEVVFNCGTDEHGLKIYRNATEAGLAPQKYVDEFAARFDKLKEALDLSYTNFIRTTDPHHMAAAQEFWRRCAANGDIEKRVYKVKYCVGCELEKTDSELIDGKCPIHPNLIIELIEEENYFFKFSRYAEKLLGLYSQHPDFVVPDFRFNEIKRFVEAGLADFSVSRLKEKMPWGVPVPDDDAHVMYVWFDALVNYISTLGWPENREDFTGFWGTPEAPNAIQFAGKDNLRQQSAMWQAMLLSAGLPPSRQVMIHGFITADGQKMSKSLGNVIDPFLVVERYGTDAFRFWVAHEANPFEDSDFTWDKFHEAYNSYLANGLGNLVSRVLRMAKSNDAFPEIEDADISAKFSALGNFDFKRFSDGIWENIHKLDQRIQETEPFRLVKSDPEAGKAIIRELVQSLYDIARVLEPLMPATSRSIISAIKEKGETGILFPRKEAAQA